MELFQRELSLLDQKIRNKKLEIEFFENEKNSLMKEKMKFIFSNYDINEEIGSELLEIRKSRRAKKKIQNWKTLKKIGKLAGSLLIVLFTGCFFLEVFDFFVFLGLLLLNAIMNSNLCEYCDWHILINKEKLANRKKLNKNIADLDSEKSKNKLLVEEIDQKLKETNEELKVLELELDNFRHMYEEILNSYEISKNNIEPSLSMEEKEKKLNLDYEEACKKIILGKEMFKN